MPNRSAWYVNNPGGRTERRTDLQDAPKPRAPRHAASATPRHLAVVAETASATQPAAKARVKAAAIARRPSAALLAQASPSTGPKKIRQNTQIAKLPTFTDEDLALMGQPGLSSPFVGDTAIVARSQAAVPSRGFKPMLSMPKQQGLCYPSNRPLFCRRSSNRSLRTCMKRRPRRL